MTTTSMQLLPPDYHKQIARELVAFFHDFYRFGGGAGAATFAPEDPAYVALLHNVLFASLVVGALVFILLCIVVVRRTILHIRSASAARVSRESHATMEISAVILLTVLAISSLSGLLGEAQVDYSAGVVREAMANTSDQFALAQQLARDGTNASGAIHFLADGLVVGFNQSELPTPAFELSIRALQLTHAAKEWSNATSVLLPSNYESLARDWQFSYFMLKSTTNYAILAVALASFMSISSIGWSMVSPLRLSIFVILSVVPISHTLIGVYLSSTILTADFCAAPLNSTATLLHTTPTVDYFVTCAPNATRPFDAYAASVSESTELVAALQKQLEDYAAHHGATGARMKREFLDPIGQQLTLLTGNLAGFNATQQCAPVAHSVARATDAYCEFGMVGFFSMWVHQMILCLILFVSVVTATIVYERVHVREAQHEMRYQLLSSYEDDDVEHVYLSSD